MSKKIYSFLLIFFVINFNFVLGEQIFIKATVNDEIITNFDVEKEGKYLKILNPKLSNIDNDKILELAKSSLVNEIIKKKEISKMLKYDIQNPLVEEYYENLYKKLNFENKEDFENSLSSPNNYSPQEIKKKLEIEIMWNELIYLRYNSQVKIDEDALKKKIDKTSNKKTREYLLSEIVFQKKKDEDINLLKNKIKTSITEIGFSNTANIYSISESAKLGGNVGWVNENNLSEIIFKNLKDLNENEITKIILIGNNFLMIKIDKIRLKETSVNKENELKKMVQFETNNQLNKFSRIFFNKSKVNYLINEN